MDSLAGDNDMIGVEISIETGPLRAIESSYCLLAIERQSAGAVLQKALWPLFSLLPPYSKSPPLTPHIYLFSFT